MPAMATTHVRVSEAAHAYLQARAKRERRTVTVIVDDLCAVGATHPAPQQGSPIKINTFPPIIPAACRCGHGSAVHGGGASGSRCQRCQCRAYHD